MGAVPSGAHGGAPRSRRRPAPFGRRSGGVRTGQTPVQADDLAPGPAPVHGRRGNQRARAGTRWVAALRDRRVAARARTPSPLHVLSCGGIRRGPRPCAAAALWVRARILPTSRLTGARAWARLHHRRRGCAGGAYSLRFRPRPSPGTRPAAHASRRHVRCVARPEAIQGGSSSPAPGIHSSPGRRTDGGEALPPARTPDGCAGHGGIGAAGLARRSAGHPGGNGARPVGGDGAAGSRCGPPYR